MMLIGVDYHPSSQTIAFFVQETGEYSEQELNHSDGKAERFYRDLKQRGICVRVGMEATGYARWFERLLANFVGAVRTPFQSGQVVAIPPPLPAIEGLAADAEVPRGACGVASVKEIKQHPAKPSLSRPA